MVNNINRLCSELVFITLSGVGVLLSTHLFTDHVFSKDFYVYYTNITNYLCLAIIIWCFIQNIKAIKQGNTFIPNKKINIIKSVACILIAITFLIYNTLLADFSLNNYFFNLYNILYHVVCPIWFIVYTLKTTKKAFWLAPALAVVFQLVYVAFVFIRASILSGKAGRIIFPYFFLNYKTLGFGGTVKWLFIMMVSTLFIGYCLQGIKWLITNKKTNKKRT